ncbi:UPF0505 protein C16orf62 homolog [Ctenocephalides felis]|uniref:UPF0505 protein C16orf62 homolog n=1 Tax=Ctenocephalides felis TaxID=7515 RepID=UPI000E6E1BA6|nr:UPF0505 protein C16orf62 homolog [Ctenocephalides felis]
MSGIQEIQWYCDINKSSKTKLRSLKWDKAEDHPLKLLVTTYTDNNLIRRNANDHNAISNTLSDPLLLDGLDPLSEFKRSENMDPLTKIAMEENTRNDKYSQNRKKQSKNLTLNSDVEPWSTRRTAILCKYTTSEKLSIVSNFLSGGEKLNFKTQPVIVDKVKTRLEQLDEFDEGTAQQMLDLNQQQYICRIEQLNQELIQAWHGDQRVRALKIAIQCSKFLADTSVIQFYPSKFVIITDILDVFGKLVYERLHSKSVYIPANCTQEVPLPEVFSSDEVPELAKETCRNWFYKIASIRELLPRLYLEMAILKSYIFLSKSQIYLAIKRITKMIRGIGSPLVAIYARCYLCRVGILISASPEDYLKENFFEILNIYDEVFSLRSIQEQCVQSIEISAYFNLFNPALDWILQNVAARASESTLDHILDTCIEKQNSGILLNNIMCSFKPEYIAKRAVLFVKLITQCGNQSYPQHILLCTFGNCLTLADPPHEELFSILTSVWEIFGHFAQTNHYLMCVESWIKYAVAHFGCFEINKLLRDLIRHMAPHKGLENYYLQLQTIIDRMISHCADLEVLITLDNFMPLIDLIQKESVRVEICKNIMNSLQNQRVAHNINDPVVINALMFICKIMHDSVNALTVEDETRQISLLISSFIRCINYGKEFEKQLSFYVEAREAFTNLESLNIQLIHSVNLLSVDTSKIVKGKHTRNTAAFVRACAAYCYITIPSISSVHTKLDLYLLSGQIALQNQCLGQADACFKAALSLIPELPKIIEVEGKKKNTEPYLVSYLSSFASTLLVVPDSPDQGVLHLTRNLLSVLEKYEFNEDSSAFVNIQFRILDMLSAAAQPQYVYHVAKVDSNDVLYGSDPKFIAEINKLCSQIVTKILEHLVVLGNKKNLILQSQIAIELFQRVVIFGDLSKPELFNLAYKLWNLSQKHLESSKLKYTNLIMKYLEIRATKTNNSYLMVLISKLQQKT